MLENRVVEIDDSSVDLYDTLRFADSACYAAKDAGRNQFKVHTYNDKDLKIRTDEMDWLAIINTALEQNLFVLYAQIIVPTIHFVRESYVYQYLGLCEEFQN